MNKKGRGLLVSFRVPFVITTPAQRGLVSFTDTVGIFRTDWIRDDKKKLFGVENVASESLAGLHALACAAEANRVSRCCSRDGHVRL